MTIENTTVERFDESVGLTGKPEKTPEGYLKVTAPIAKIGIMKYRLKDGSTRRELVNEDTLFNSDSIKSLELKPVTNTHPKEMLLDSTNTKRRNVGTVGETIARDGDKLTATFIINDQTAIDAIEAGRSQLSPGYKTKLDMTPGVWNGQNYDAIQTEREYNHLALVDNARGGDTIKINMDSEVEVGLEDIEHNDEEIQPNKEGAVQMKTINIDSAEVEVEDGVATYVSKLEGRADSAEEKVADLQKTNGELQTKVDSFDAELKTRTDSAVAERVELITTAKDCFNSDSDDDKAVLAKLDGMDNKALKTAIILNVQPSAKAKLDSNEDDSYLDSRFDSAKEMLFEKKKKKEEEDKQDALDKGRLNLRAPKVAKIDEDDKSVEAAAARMARNDANAWKPQEN